MQSYLSIVEKVLSEGKIKSNRTGIDTLAIPGATFEHDMAEGFPLITTKYVSLRLVASELEFFIRGLTNKEWLQKRGNHIWDNWCSPIKVPYGTSKKIKEKMVKEKDLGPIYGYQWRNFNGVDQLKNIINTLKNNPNDRRMVVSAWNPPDIPKMALPPCHYCFQVTVIDNKLSLSWNQRSVDVALGLPFDIASYALLLHLLAKEAKLKEGKLIGFLMDTHIYNNHLAGIKEQLLRYPLTLPKIYTNNFKSIFDWLYTDTTTIGYNSYPRIKFEIAI